VHHCLPNRSFGILPAGRIRSYNGGNLSNLVESVEVKIVIIGNSAAGTGALEAFRKRDQTSPVTIVSDEKIPLYSRCLLSYYLADDIAKSRLQFRDSDFHSRLNAKLILGSRVESVDPKTQQVFFNNGSRLDYDRLLIATGGSAKLPSNIPSDVSGIFVLRNLADAEAIRKHIEPSGKAVVLGGGLVGMKAAFALKKRGMDVTVVVRSPYVLSQMIDAGAARIVMERLEGNAIKVLTGADIAHVESAKGHIAGVKIEQTASQSTKAESQSQPCNLMIVAKGVSPNMDLICDTDIRRNRGIVTDSKMQTSNENVYAAGDVAETFDIATGQHSVNALWTCAMQQGKIAGYNMAGTRWEYDGSVGMNSINFPGVDLISFGIVAPKDPKEYEIQIDDRRQNHMYKKVVLKDNVIKGLVLVNSIDNAGVLLSLLGRKVDVSGLRGELLNDNFTYAKVIGSGGKAEYSRFLKASSTMENKT
jgi:nitrite reductase (NADH) large subunit